MKILVVEDDRRMADLLRQGLSEEGHTVVVASEGRGGLAAAETGGFDLLLLDVMLPGLDGFSIARRLRAQRNQTPILMLTARDATPDIVEGLDVGADDYLTKPFSLEVLFARVRALGPPRPAAATRTARARAISPWISTRATSAAPAATSRSPAPSLRSSNSCCATPAASFRATR